MSNTSNRIFAFIFFVIVLLLLLWMPTWTKINVGDAPGVIYSPPWIGFLVILIGLAYEIFRPSLNLKRDTNWKWILTGTFLFLISFLISGIDPTGGYYSRFTRIELLSQYWFQLDFWSELVILVGALWLLFKGKKSVAVAKPN